LAITNCTLNTVLDALAEGVPLVGLPLAFEQPGIAARVEYHRVGELVALQRASVKGLRAAISRVLRQPHFRAAAAGMRGAIESAGGVQRAASVIERALLTGQPVAPLSTNFPPHLSEPWRSEGGMVASTSQASA
jgi:UDP:flavonoid glycosyltransferase YjiC (YdhE family)